MTFPLCVSFALLFAPDLMKDSLRKQKERNAMSCNPICKWCCVYPVTVLMVLCGIGMLLFHVLIYVYICCFDLYTDLFLVFGLIFGTLACEIGHFCYYALLSHLAIDERFLSDPTKELMRKLLVFVRKGNNEDNIRGNFLKLSCKQSFIFKKEYFARVGATDIQTKRLFAINTIIDDSFNRFNFKASAKEIFCDPNKQFTSQALFHSDSKSMNKSCFVFLCLYFPFCD